MDEDENIYFYDYDNDNNEDDIPDPDLYGPRAPRCPHCSRSYGNHTAATSPVWITCSFCGHRFKNTSVGKPSRVSNWPTVFELCIELRNDAFGVHDQNEADMIHEIRRILLTFASTKLLTMGRLGKVPLLDVNGNTAGHASLRRKKDTVLARSKLGKTK